VFDQPVLRKKAKPVREVNETLTRFVEDMFETMRGAMGIGLAATQVGSTQRVVTIDISETEEGKGSHPLVLLNPEIVREEGERTMEEGCLSLPDLRDEITRPERVLVTYRDMEFKEQEIFADGMLARVMQHEIDHLNGVLFIDKLGLVRRKLLTGRLNKMRKGQVEANYPTVGAIYVPPDPNAPREFRD
jgi:peptide deformylase